MTGSLLCDSLYLIWGILVEWLMMMHPTDPHNPESLITNPLPLYDADEACDTDSSPSALGTL